MYLFLVDSPGPFLYLLGLGGMSLLKRDLDIYLPVGFIRHLWTQQRHRP